MHRWIDENTEWKYFEKCLTGDIRKGGNTMKTFGTFIDNGIIEIDSKDD